MPMPDMPHRNHSPDIAVSHPIISTQAMSGEILVHGTHCTEGMYAHARDYAVTLRRPRPQVLKRRAQFAYHSRPSSALCVFRAAM